MRIIIYFRTSSITMQQRQDKMIGKLAKAVNLGLI